MNCAFVMLSNGKHALVDESDLEIVEQFRWQMHSRGYVVTFADYPAPLYLHRFIADPEKGQPVDHANHLKYDNRRSNLRKCSFSQSIGNTRKHKSAKVTSRYKGVGWDKRANKWRARGYANQKEVMLGWFTSQEDAAMAYDRWAVKNFGEFAFPNFP